MKKSTLFVSLVLAAGCGDKKSGTGGNNPPPPDMAMCFMAPSDSAFATQRTACGFAAGATPADTVGVTDELRARLPIKHVIVLMKENRSFDHMLGHLSAAGQPDAEPLQAGFTNPDANNVAVPQTHATTTCIQYDPEHQWNDMHAMVDGGKMDGFIKNAQLHNAPAPMQPPSDGHFVMGYYDEKDLPFYYWLANTFALADHHYPSVRSGTWSNRDFLVAGTSHGTKNTSDDPALPPSVPIIFDKLDAAKVSWQVYTDDLVPFEYALDWGGRNRPPAASLADFFAALQADKLPAVTFVDGVSALGVSTSILKDETDEHPTADVQVGENWTRDLIVKLIASPAWASTALFYTYDEAGGFADHVPPPSDSCLPSTDPWDVGFTELGVRVPLVVVSPYAKRHFVSHARHEHTSILRFIETLFNVPALTARDANSDAMLDLFDFCNPQMTVDAPPAAGTGGCQ